MCNPWHYLNELQVKDTGSGIRKFGVKISSELNMKLSGSLSCNWLLLSNTILGYFLNRQGRVFVTHQ